MPGQHSDEERERKERIKKMKIKTSKMRLAVVKKKSSVYGDYLPPKEAKPAYKELFKKNNITNEKEFNDYADKNKKVLEKSKLPGKDYLSVYSLDNAKKYKSSALKKKKKEYDQDGENEHNRDNYNAQSSVETGGDY